MEDQLWETTLTAPPRPDIKIISRLDTVADYRRKIDSVWMVVQTAIKTCFTNSPLHDSKTSIYNACQVLCLVGMEVKVIHEIKRALDDELSAQLKTLEVEVNNIVEDPARDRCVFESEYLSLISRLDERCDSIECLFPILTQYYPVYLNATHLRAFGLLILRDALARSIIFRYSLDLIKRILMQCRKTKTKDGTQAVSKMTQFACDLQLYDVMAEPEILEDSKSYYEILSSTWIPLNQSIDLQRYVDSVEEVNTLEDHILSQCLPNNTIDKLKTTRAYNLLGRHIDSVLYGFAHPKPLSFARRNLGLYNLMVNKDYSLIKRLYGLCESIGCLNDFYRYWQFSIEEEVSFSLEYDNVNGSVQLTVLHKDQESLDRAIQCISGLIDFMDTLTQIQDIALSDDKEITTVTRMAFIKVLNSPPEREETSATLLALYSHHLLQDSTLDEKEMKSRVKNIINMLRCLRGKDIYQEVYYEKLRERLLFNSSRSIDDEQAFMLLLTNECDQQAIRRIKVLLKEITVSSEIFNQFNNPRDQRQQREDELQFHCVVLPYRSCSAHLCHENNTIPTTNISLLFTPAFRCVIRDCIVWHYAKKRGRNLYWSSAYSTCVIAAHISDTTGHVKHYTLKMSQLQALCVFLFNERDSVTLEEMISTTMLDPQNIVDELQPLCSGAPTSLLVRDQTTDIYSLCPHFTSACPDISFVHTRFVRQTDSMTTPKVYQEEDHSYHVDALVMRIMKSVKRLEHILLVHRVAQELKVPLSTTLIEARIDALIQRGTVTKRNVDETWSVS